MAQQNPHNNELGGFANRQFVLMHGEFWDSNVTRRYIQGQVWLSEFTDILLLCCKNITEIPMWEPHNRNTKPLDEKGSLEILRYAWTQANELQIDGYVAIAKKFANIISHRNEMTHEVRPWSAKNESLENLLSEIKGTASILELRFETSRELHTTIQDFRSKCEIELQQMRDPDLRSLY